MTIYIHEHALRAQFRELAARDRQLERWRWFQRDEHRPGKVGWRFRIGEALVRLGCRLQGQGAPRPARSSGKL